jgi:hypothetical protein
MDVASTFAEYDSCLNGIKLQNLQMEKESYEEIYSSSIWHMKRSLIENLFQHKTVWSLRMTKKRLFVPLINACFSP